MGIELRICTAVYVFFALDFIREAMDAVGLKRCACSLPYTPMGRMQILGDVGWCGQVPVVVHFRSCRSSPVLHAVVIRQVDMNANEEVDQ